jgi:hypothetical protein
MVRISSHSIDDGAARYASRTRVNKLVLDFEGENGLGGTDTASLTQHINGQIQTIYIDCTDGKLTANTDSQTVMGTFSITNGDYTSLDGSPMYLCSPVTGLDFTNKPTANSGIINKRTYMLQTKEGSDSAQQLLDAYPMHSGHSTPALPSMAGPAVTTANSGSAVASTLTTQPWTGLVAGKVTFTLSLLNPGGVTFHTETKYRVTILYT